MTAARTPGRTWESVNIASVWKLPLIVVCENNMYAVETQTEHADRRRLDLAPGRGLRAAGPAPSTARTSRRCTVRPGRPESAPRRGEGPTFIEASTYRYEGHSTGQVINYRTIEEVREWRDTRDPIQRLRLALDAAGALDEDAFDALVASVRERGR